MTLLLSFFFNTKIFFFPDNNRVSDNKTASLESDYANRKKEITAIVAETKKYLSSAEPALEQFINSKPFSEMEVSLI